MSDYLFLIVCESSNQQTEIKLRGDNTVGHVKLRIQERLHIHPSDQVLRGWPVEPVDDNESLKSFLPNVQNVLWVSPASTIDDCERNLPGLSNRKMEAVASLNNGHRDVGEVEAAVSFFSEYEETYGNDHVTFHTSSLGEAIAEACFAPIQLRKTLVLYFHNETDAFCKLLCSCLTKGDVRDILERSYYFLGWNISDSAFHGALKEALNENINFDDLPKMVDERRGALVIIYPVEHSLTVFSLLCGNKVNRGDIQTMLKQIEECFRSEINDELELERISNKADNDIGSTEYQQMMYDRLGNRDYDCFESDEHEYLKSKIGFAKFGPPKTEDGKYEKKQNKEIENAYKQIVSENNSYAEYQDQVIISFIYNCLEPLPKEKIARAKKYPDYNPNTDLDPVPIFVLRKCRGSPNPCRIFIDDDNRVYKSWKDYIQDNKLDKRMMVLPQDGRYIGDDEGNVCLERYLSPACGIGKEILKSADVASTIGGLVSGGVFIAAMIPAIPVAAPVILAAAATGIGVGIYSLGRSIHNIFDRATHNESLSFANSEARGAYINIVAGTLGFVGVGATTAVSQLAGRGINIGQGAQSAVNAVALLNIGASATSVGNSTYQVIDDWIREQQKPSLLTMVQLSSAILFFGNAVYTFKTAQVIIEESQTNTLQNYQDSLQSNKHRRILNKLIKETTRQNSGDVAKGNAEVISAIRKIGNRDEMFAILNRNNKLFNENGVRFAADGGKIKLNGILVDLLEFASIKKPDRAQMLIELPPMPAPDAVPATIGSSATQNVIETLFNLRGSVTAAAKYVQLVNLGSCTLADVVDCVLKDFSGLVKEKVVRIYKALVDRLYKDMNFNWVSEEYFNKAGNETAMVIFGFLIDFLKKKTSDYGEKYEQEKTAAANADPNFNETEFDQNYGVFTPHTVKRGLFWFENVVGAFVRGFRIDVVLFRELVQYVMNEITLKCYENLNMLEKTKKRQDNTKQNTNKIECQMCGGYYFTA